MQLLSSGQEFLNKYRDSSYRTLPASPLLDPSVPMTFVGSAGLTQIENAIYEGEDHSGERYVLIQPCFRHFDVEKVGHSSIHLSLFNMGGAFAFGRVAREDTLGTLLSFLVDDLGMDQKRLWATCFSGGSLAGHRLPRDEATFWAWNQLGFPASRLIETNVDAGFWIQGDGLTGKERYRKCGSTTELFFEQKPQRACSTNCRAGCACGRFIEIANILFIHWQYDEFAQTLTPLPMPFDETVIGIERVTMAIEEVDSVFELAVFSPVFNELRQHYPFLRSWQTDVNIEQGERIIVDHLMALVQLAADGAPPPGKGGRSRIMRVLIRQLLTHLEILGIQSKGCLIDLIDLILNLQSQSTIEPMSIRERLLQYIEMEQHSFSKTLSRGQRQLDRILAVTDGNRLNGKQAVQLVKEYGFPLPLLKARLEKRGVSLIPEEYWLMHDTWRKTTASR